MIDIALRRRLGGFALDVTFSAPSGVTALFGHSGSGKTSVIQAVAGLARPDAGRIAVAGTVLFDSERRIDLPPPRRRCGYVFQDARLFPHLSVAGNLRYGLRRADHPADPAQWAQVVGMLGIGPLLARRPHRLSGGEKQRVAIGRALLMRPRILLLDEPLAALDAARKAEILPYLEGVRRLSGVPILYVSHAVEEVLRLADHVVLLDNGRVAATGPVAEIFARPDLAHLTGDGEAGAIIDGQVTAIDAAWGMTTLSFPGGDLHVPDCPAPLGARLVLRIRARDITLARDPPAAISTRNLLAGTIIGLRDVSAAQVDVSFAVGPTRLYARLTREAVARLALAPGTPVHALIKGVAVSGVSAAC